MTARPDVESLLRECEQLITERLHGPGVDELLSRVRAALPRYVVEQRGVGWRVVDTVEDRVLQELQMRDIADLLASRMNERES